MQLRIAAIHHTKRVGTHMSTHKLRTAHPTHRILARVIPLVEPCCLRRDHTHSMTSSVCAAGQCWLAPPTSTTTPPHPHTTVGGGGYLDTFASCFLGLGPVTYHDLCIHNWHRIRATQRPMLGWSSYKVCLCRILLYTNTTATPRNPSYWSWPLNSALTLRRVS